MNGNTIKAGVRSTEFFALIAVGVFTVVSGLTITEGVVNYRANQEMMDLMTYTVMTYIGSRSGIKAVQTAVAGFRKPAELPGPEARTNVRIPAEDRKEPVA